MQVSKEKRHWATVNSCGCIFQPGCGWSTRLWPHCIL